MAGAGNDPISSRRWFCAPNHIGGSCSSTRNVANYDRQIQSGCLHTATNARLAFSESVLKENNVRLDSEGTLHAQINDRGSVSGPKAAGAHFSGSESSATQGSPDFGAAKNPALKALADFCEGLFPRNLPSPISARERFSRIECRRFRRAAQQNRQYFRVSERPRASTATRAVAQCRDQALPSAFLPLSFGWA